MSRSGGCVINRKITYSVFTDKGGRSVNEDSAGVFPNGENVCFVLCDGLGGHGMGDIASGITVSAFGRAFAEDPAPPEFLKRAFGLSQSTVLNEQAARKAADKMKTTCVSAVKHGKKLYIGHIGDSRCYVFGGGKIIFRTHDHSVPGMLALSGAISESEIRHHPDRNSLLRAIGTEWRKPMYELSKPLPIRKCGALLLCSDGFWELIREEEMLGTLQSTTGTEEWLSEMTRIVRKNGEGRDMDNYSAIAVRIGNGAENVG